MFTRILVPTDFSPPSDVALEWTQSHGKPLFPDTWGNRHAAGRIREIPEKAPVIAAGIAAPLRVFPAKGKFSAAAPGGSGVVFMKSAKTGGKPHGMAVALCRGNAPD